jgi:hypothetical protein
MTQREIWKAASARYRARHPERYAESQRRYNAKPKRRAAVRAYDKTRRPRRSKEFRMNNRPAWDRIEIRSRLASKLQIPGKAIPDAIVRRRSILRQVRRELKRIRTNENSNANQ